MVHFNVIFYGHNRNADGRMYLKVSQANADVMVISPHPYLRIGGGIWSSSKYVGTCLRAAGSSPAPPAVWAFWRLIWRTESLDRGLILVCRFSLGSAYQLWLRPALVGCTCVTLYCSQMGKRLSQRRATCAGGMIIVSECLSYLDSITVKDNKLE
jgi:hypothetical protein